MRANASFDSSSYLGLDTTNATAGAVYGSTITGVMGVAKLGANNLTLTSANTYAGQTIIRGGTLTLANANALQNSTLFYDNFGGFVSFGTLTSVNLGGLRGHQNLALTNENSQSVALIISTTAPDDSSNCSIGFSGILSGDGSLTKIGSGTATLSGANTYTGGTTLNAGTLQATTAAALPGYSITGKVSVGSGATLTVNYGGGSDWTSVDVDTLRAKASFASGSFLGFDTTNATTGTVYGSTISGEIGVRKLGANSLTFSGANIYTGPTTITAGTLALGSSASLASSLIDVAGGATFDVSAMSGGYSLSAAQTLKGSGTVLGDVTINGIHAPGDSPGIQTIQGDYDMLGVLQIELTGADAGTGYDQVLLSGPDSYDANLGGILALDWTGFGGSSDETQLWILKNDTLGALTGEFSNYADGASLGSHDGRQWWIWYGADAATGTLAGGNDVLISPVPEPSSLILLGVGAVGLFGYVWLRRRRMARLP